jgi:erythromycin esterase-like protein
MQKHFVLKKILLVNKLTKKIVVLVGEVSHNRRNIFIVKEK